MKTRIEQLLEQAVLANSTVLPIDGSCDVVVTTGPSRIATKDPTAFRNLAAAALNGSAAKQILSVAPAAATDGTLTLTARSCAYLLRIAGSLNAFRYSPVAFTVASGTGFTAFNYTVYPKRNIVEVLVIITAENQGLGQIAVNGGNYVLTHPNADNPNQDNEYVVTLESINMRDFTDRQAS